MTISRIFQNTLLTLDSIIALDQLASHHLSRVLRAQVGDHIIIFNGQGGEYESTITQINKKNVTVRIEKFYSRDVESPLELCLVQGISRGEKMDYTIQKAVELGVKKIIPVLAERCTVKLDEERRGKRWQHWNSIVINACEQSGRTKIPELRKPVLLSDWLQEKMPADFSFILIPPGVKQAKKKLKEIHIESSSRILLLMGPEGGLTQQEIQQACENGFTLLNLGSRILRTETAAVAALTAFQCLWGDM